MHIAAIPVSIERTRDEKGAPERRRARARRVWLALAVASLALAGCTVADTFRSAVPAEQAASADIAGFGDIRLWGDDPNGVGEARLAELQQQRQAAGAADPSFDATQMNALTLSGGGSNGAFGAGLLTGWTRSGNRPRFDLVTGISTGALIAPFAFLGSEYDGQLTEAFTGVDGRDIYALHNPLAATATAAFASNAPLRRIVQKYVTDAMLDAVAREHAKGRRLLVGTTNIDAERPVIWDMGAIASSANPERRKLFQDIVLASAAIPGVFPPVKLKVTAGGRQYDELHVDGGTSNQVFLLPAGFSFRQIAPGRNGKAPKRRLFVVRNASTTPDYKTVRPGFVPLVLRSVSSLIRTQGIGDIYRLYAFAERDGIDFHYVEIPADFTDEEKHPFEQRYMRALYDRAYSQAVGGIPWSKTPPGFQPGD